jgi:hypothetical protein
LVADAIVGSEATQEIEAIARAMPAFRAEHGGQGAGPQARPETEAGPVRVEAG